MNSVNIIGRLTKEVELKTTKGGKKYAKNTIAIRRDADSSDFINIVAWEKSAELLANHFSKGKLIGITGRIQTGSYTNGKGEKVCTTDIVVGSITFVESNEKEVDAPKQTKKESPKQPVEDDDFPF